MKRDLDPAFSTDRRFIDGVDVYVYDVDQEQAFEKALPYVQVLKRVAHTMLGTQHATPVLFFKKNRNTMAEMVIPIPEGLDMSDLNFFFSMLHLVLEREFGSFLRKEFRPYEEKFIYRDLVSRLGVPMSNFRQVDDGIKLHYFKDDKTVDGLWAMFSVTLAADAR